MQQLITAIVTPVSCEGGFRFVGLVNATKPGSIEFAT